MLVIFSHHGLFFSHPSTEYLNLSLHYFGRVIAPICPIMSSSAGPERAEDDGPAIVNGEPVLDKAEAPFTVRLEIVLRGAQGALCSAALIKPSYVLTAAHCIYVPDSASRTTSRYVTTVKKKN